MYIAELLSLIGETRLHTQTVYSILFGWRTLHIYSIGQIF